MVLEKSLELKDPKLKARIPTKSQSAEVSDHSKDKESKEDKKTVQPYNFIGTDMDCPPNLGSTIGS